MSKDLSGVARNLEKIMDDLGEGCLTPEQTLQIVKDTIGDGIVADWVRQKESLSQIYNVLATLGEALNYYGTL